MSPQSKNTKTSPRKRTTRKTAKPPQEKSKFKDAGKELGDAAKKLEEAVVLAASGLKDESSAFITWISGGESTKAVKRAVNGIVRSFNQHRSKKKTSNTE